MLDYITRYPTKIISGDAAYPYGKARNVGTPGDGTGTPWDQDLINDLIFAPAQAVMQAAGLTPNGDVDTATNSQFLEAIQKLSRPQPRFFQGTVTGSAITPGNYFTITSSLTNGGFSVESGNSVVVPEAGWYRITFKSEMESQSESEPAYIVVEVEANAVVVGRFEGTRHSDSAGDHTDVCGGFIVQITDPSTQKIKLKVGTVVALTMASDAASNIIMVEQIGRGT